MIFNILTKIILIAIIIVIIAVLILIWCALDDHKRKRIYGSHYNEDHFRDYDSNDCLVTKNEREKYNLPDYIRYKGTDILNNKTVYCEGCRINDRFFIFDDKGNDIELRSISRKTGEYRNDILEFQKHFTDCKAIVKVDVKENTYYMYCC